MLVSVDCLVPKEMLDLVVSTVVMVVRVPKERLELKALLVSVGCLVSKGMLDLVVSTAVMVVTE